MGAIYTIKGIAFETISPGALRGRYYRVVKSKSYSVGDYTYGTPKIVSWDEDSVLRIGKFCSIASRVTVLLGGHHNYEYVTTYPFSFFINTWPEAKSGNCDPPWRGDVIIGNDVWIGYGATIIPGIEISDGVVVGAKSVVTSDVEPYTVVAGNPARVVRQRFDSDIVSQLLEIKWWDWPYERIAKAIPLMQSERLDLFLDLAQDRRD